MKSLSNIQDLYKATPKPSRFGNPDHCSECAEHNATLMSHTPEGISLAELGNPLWDPICFVDSIDAFRYYLPAFARLSAGTGDDYYLGQFLFHLNTNRIEALDQSERRAIAAFLEELTDLIPEEIDLNLDADDILARITELRSVPPNKSSHWKRGGQGSR